MKKTVGIITLFGNTNYGNKLQNYALQKVLEDMNFNVQTIKTLKISKKKTFFEKILIYRSNLLEIIISKLNNRKNRMIENKRLEKFIQFSKQYLNETESIIFENAIPENLKNEYDFFITGSDQVWHPTFGASSLEFLSFVPEFKRISYAASFGISNIPSHLKEYYKTELEKMKSISVREETGAKIVRELIGDDVDVHVDPTMLLNKNKWLKIINTSKVKSHNYILTYFLGEAYNEYNNWIKTFSRKHNLEIINILDIKNEQIYTSDPSEFLGLISNATLMCTDSFHGSVFSIIFETNFMVFDRIKNNEAVMGSRIETLLEKFNFNSRKWKNNISDNDVLNMSFMHSKAILEYEQHKALTYLRKALKVED